MKFAFLDESGKAPDEVSVIAGVIIDAYRIHSSRREWIKILDSMKSLAGVSINEFHARNVYSGRKEWAGAPPSNRVRAIDILLEWLAVKSHPIVFSATLRSAYEARLTSGCAMIHELGSRWVAEAFHIALSVNKAHKNIRGNKGKSVLIFDRGSGYEERLSKLLVFPPSWSDTYYQKDDRQERFSAIMDTSFFVDSLYAPLIQLADAVAFILRRFAEVSDAGNSERYHGELANLERWIYRTGLQFQSVAHRYKRSGRCPCSDLFWEIAPPSLRRIG